MIIDKLELPNGTFWYGVDTVENRQELLDLGVDVDAVERGMTIKENIDGINNWYENEVANLVSGTSETERGTWFKQEQEARGYLADNASQTPFIDALAENRGISKNYLITRIIQKADLYAEALGTLTGLRQKKVDEL